MRFFYVFFFLSITKFVFAQVDTLEVIEYDTVIVNKPPVVINKEVLMIDKKSLLKEYYAGLTLGPNYHTSFYYTCENCKVYQPYAEQIDSALTEVPGVSLGGFFLTNLNEKYYIEINTRYHLYRQRFNKGNVKTNNKYQQVGAGISLLRKIKEDGNTKLFVGIGGSFNYLFSTSGKTLTIFQEEEVAEINNFRKLNTLFGSARLMVQYYRRILPSIHVLIQPEVGYEFVSLTSYKEYYLETQLLYYLHLGLVKEF